MKRTRTGNPETAAPPRSEGARAGMPSGFVLLVFLSGATALVYQILWMRQLGLVFGNGAHAAAVTLAVFFGGLAWGSGFWGRRSVRLARPMRTYALLEVGIGAAGVLCLLLLPLYRGVYPRLYEQWGDGGLWLVRGLLALGMVLPPAFLMGGTLPLLGRRLIRESRTFGTTSAALYGTNTLGAAVGAFAAAFLMLPTLGLRWSCLAATLTSLLVAALAYRLGRGDDPAPDPVVRDGEAARDDPSHDKPAVSRRLIRLLAFLSGFNILALEVLWTRMFAQVHENSVYSFAVVLVVVLLALGAGAWLAARIAARVSGPVPALLVLTTLSGLSVCLVPMLFMRLTHSLQMLAEQGSFAAYVVQLFATALGAIGVPCLLLGTLFPFLMKAEERFASEPGRSIGGLTAVNTLGAIAGSLVCGFVLLETLGMWRSMQVLAATYLLLTLLLPTRGHFLGGPIKVASALFAVFCFSVWSPAKLPVTGFDPDEGPQQVVEQWESSDCTVTVVKKENGEHAIRINSNYSLGSSEAYMTQIYQTRVPLLAFPDTESLFYLGMGTGITAGEALDRRDFDQVERVVVCELSPMVVTAARKYFGGSPGRPDLTNGLFKDPRATVLARDGRNQLMASADRYDMINADLFLPYRSGTGSLYSLEHFRTVRERLNPGGVFIQWLPLYQMSEYEFGVISRTMLEAFDRVSLWRNHFQPGNEAVAMVGHRDETALPPCALDTARDQRWAIDGATASDLPRVVLPVNQQTILLFYCGNLSASRDRFAGYPLNTDDHPVIEFGTPRSLRRAGDGERPHFVADKFASLVDHLLATCPPADDPLLADRLPRMQRLPLAGAAFHRAWISLANADRGALASHWDEFCREWTASTEDDDD